MFRTLVVLAVLLCLSGSVWGQKPPEEALKTFRVVPGLRLELFAAEPMLVNPTCLDVDHRGRVWVCESVNYRCDLRKVPRNRPEGDRILVLEDKDGDGRADAVQTFYQSPDFIAPLGIAVMPLPDGPGQRVFVCHSPHLYVFDDRDGDLKADGPPRIVLTGFRGYDHDHGLHGVHFGPDGKLYFSVGDSGVENLQSSDGTGRKWTSNSTDCRAGTIWRCNLDGTGLELLAHNFRNQYEPAVDSFGTIFTSDNDDDGNQQTRICFVMPGGNYGYHPRGKGESHWHEEQPGIVPKVLRTGFGSPTGLCWYESDRLREVLLKSLPDVDPKRLYGLLLHTDAGPREVRCFVVQTQGAGFTLEKINLVTSDDTWFRPSDLCVAPDGSVFVSDWYDPGVGGHGMGDISRGRIYRLVAGESKDYTVPPWDLGSQNGLLAALSSPNLAARQGAVLKLRQLPEEEQLRLYDQIQASEASAHVKARSAWVISTTQGFEARLVDTCRAWLRLDDRELIRKLKQHLEPGKNAEMPPLTLLVRLVSQRYSSLGQAPMEVRDLLRRAGQLLDHLPMAREMLLALRNAEAEEVRRHFPALLRKFDGEDRFYLAAVGIAAGHDPTRRQRILENFAHQFLGFDRRTAWLIWELRPPEVVEQLPERLTDTRLRPEQREFVLEILAHCPVQSGRNLLLALRNPEALGDLAEKVADVVARNLQGSWQELRKGPELPEIATALLESPKHQRLGIRLAVASGSEPLAEKLIDLANKDDADREIRRVAVQAISQWKSDRFVIPLATLMDQRDLQHEAVASLGIIATPKALDLLQEVVLDGGRPNALRTAAMRALSGSRQGSQRLLALHEQKRLPHALVGDAGSLLRSSPFEDVRSKAAVLFPAAGKIDPSKLPAISSLVTRQGDARRGKELLAVKELGCLRCHTVRGVGGNVGPDLSLIGKKASRENLFESLLYPDKAIADQFVQHIVLDRQGVTITGVLIEETSEYVLIRDGLAKDHKIAKEDIENRGTSKKSIMPSDLVAHLSEAELVDIVAYLETLKTPALSVDAWQILGPFDNGSRDEGLLKALAPERDLVQAARARSSSDKSNQTASANELPSGPFDGKHGKVSWKTVRPNAEGYVDLAAFFAPGNRQIVSYLYKEIESPANQDATVLFGTDDGCRLWVNGEEVARHTRHEPAQPERDAISVRLHAGRNTILMKINNGDGPHGFYFTILSEQELRNLPSTSK
ncbi:MAG: HEAT repeat domain-containing protein [Gemmatales bacterium]|nr:HEAT repeat domain-containing protein [Gemmatales bacterium]MDW8387075.1 c-type cytochrome [Gemmatales bacterium]